MAIGSQTPGPAEQASPPTASTDLPRTSLGVTRSCARFEFAEQEPEGRLPRLTRVGLWIRWPLSFWPVGDPE
jgi:hypothetical protein